DLAARRIAVNFCQSARQRWSREPLPVRRHGLPSEAGGCLGRLLETRVEFPNSGSPSSPCSHGQAPLSPSGTRLGTQIPVEESNCNRIRSLEGRRPRIGYPVPLQDVGVGLRPHPVVFSLGSPRFGGVGTLSSAPPLRSDLGTRRSIESLL